MKEYRVVGYFTKNWTPKVYKRKIVTTREAAETLLEEAKRSYAEKYRYNYLDKLVIEEREVSEWYSTEEFTASSETFKEMKFDG